MRKLIVLLTVGGGLWAALRQSRLVLARDWPALTYDDFYDTAVTG